MDRKNIRSLVLLGINLFIIFGWFLFFNGLHRSYSFGVYLRVLNMDIPINQKFIFNFNYFVFILIFILIIKEILLINRPRLTLMINKICIFVIIGCIGYSILSTITVCGRAFDEPSDFNKMPIRIRK